MRFFLQLTVMIVCAGVSLVAFSVEKPKMGVIQGSVNYCGKGGVDGMQVYIPGLPHVVITGSDGRFQLTNLPEGKYALHYRLGGRLLNRNGGVTVSAKLVTDLSVISFCDQRGISAGQASPLTGVPLVEPAPAQDAVGMSQPNCESDPAACNDIDGDGVIATHDCDDNNAKTHPGAVEICDGRDNNCNGQVDENAMAFVFNGIGRCQAGEVTVETCKDGFSNCDGEVSNGCEADIQNDVEHCGACDEECTPTEICVAGGCE